MRQWRRRLPLSANVLVGVATAICAGLVFSDPGLWPITLFGIPLVLGNLLVDPRRLPWFIVVVVGLMVLAVPRQPIITPRVAIAFTTMFVLGFGILLASFRRSRLGVAGATGESMLVDLRDRIQAQGEIPPLPGEWYAESAIRSAGGSRFAGDFVVAFLGGPEHEPRLSVLVVDVSGKGEAAGIRSLLLSGCFGGLLGALDPEQFLPAANDFLLRQNWQEGFASAIHLELDLNSGSFELRCAGHPPPVQRIASSGRWLVHPTEGPILGVIEDVEFPVVKGHLAPEDSLMLYTDGMVEARDRDIDMGIDRLVGRSEQLLREGCQDGAARLVSALGSSRDDRALMLVHRNPEFARPGTSPRVTSSG